MSADKALSSFVDSAPPGEVLQPPTKLPERVSNTT
jgi:capping protein alpha